MLAPDARRGASLRDGALPLLAIVVLAALLRLPTLGVQSFWLDEAVTADLMHLSFGDLVSAIWDGESTPPLYYALAWVWTHVFGSGEVGLRSLSAVLGIATVPIAAAIGQRLGGRRAALLAAALVACNPLLAWYGQEARAYALLIPLTALSVLLALRALERPAVERLLAWGAVCALALATHYFAVYVVAVEALWLLWAMRPRPGGRGRIPVLAGLAVPVVAAAALAPLALHQRANDTASFIRGSGLATRAAQIPKQWLIGYDAPHEAVLAALAALLVAVGVAGLVLVLREARPERRLVAGVLAVTVGAVVLPLVLAVGGEDQLLTRNVVGALTLALCLVAVGLARLGARVALAVAVVLCAGWTALVVDVARDPALQRDDWRGAVEALDAAAGPRAVVVSPGSGRIPVAHYLDRSALMAPAGEPVREIDLLALAERAPGEAPRPPRPAEVPPPAPGFTLVERRQGPTFTVLRFRAQAPVRVTPGALAPHALDARGPVVLLQRP